MKGNETTKRPGHTSQMDELAVEILTKLVPDQRSQFIDGEGHIYESQCQDMDGMAITRVTKNGKPFARHVYFYETEEEHLFWEAKK